jgi:hypothetical protein
MPRYTKTVDVALPEDLALLFADVTNEPKAMRNGLATILIDGAATVSTAITFLQGPPALDYWIERVKPWLQRRRHEGTGEMRITGPQGDLHLRFDANTDLGEVAAFMHRHLFPQTEEFVARDPDDLA